MARGQTTLSIESKLLSSDCFITVIYFFCKTKTELRNVTESEYKKMYKCIMLPRHTRVLVSSNCHHGSVSSECE